MSLAETMLLRYRFNADSAELRAMRDQVRDALQAVVNDAEYLNAVVLALDEACSNVIRHAYPEQQAGEIVLEIERGDEQLIFRVIDFAPPCDPSKIRSRDLDDIRPGGLGVHLISSIMDEVMHQDVKNGNILQMIKTLPEGER
ncbi:MAG: ATP-binding protein [gamma proteobacterium symbiont of Bathyaustriella thionipta]|nr:ATP-binding protein [gamma proteobacterium symbiont of Bathyaustriella thionipta]